MRSLPLKSKNSLANKMTECVRFKTSISKLLIILILSTLIHGCSTAHKQSSNTKAGIESRDIVIGESALEKHAKTTTTTQDTGDYASAYNEQSYQRKQAEHYANLVTQNESSTQTNTLANNDALLNSAELFIQAADPSQAKQQVSRLDFAKLSQQQRNRLVIIKAYISYAEHDYRMALQQLEPILNKTTASVAQQHLQSQQHLQHVDAHLLSSLCYQGLGNNDFAIYHLIQREKLLSGSARSENSRYLSNFINSIDEQERLLIYQNTEMFEVRNRISHNNISTHNHLDKDKEIQPTQFEQWNSAHSTGQSVLINNAWQNNSPKRIAILLPLTSRFAKAAEALKAGLQFQHSLNESPYRPTIDVYDIGGNPFEVAKYYQSAWQNGADFILGPLGKDYANQLTSYLDQSNTPTILLGGDRPIQNSNVTRLSLSPEIEGVNVAQKAFEQGFVNAALLTPVSENGKRTARAFTDYWLAHGGSISKTVEYSEQQFDHSTEIKLLFELNQSDYRHRQLSNTLGFKPKFSAYQRKDVDFIFMLANNKTGRLLKPQINFYNSSNTPVIASESIYNGIVDETNNFDLNNVEFPVMPWIIESEISSQYAGQLNRLFAMGMDAYQIAGQYNTLKHNPNARINGKMGVLHITPDHQIHYTPVWAKIANGLAVSKEITASTQSIEQRRLLIDQQQNKQGLQQNLYDESNWDARESRRKTGS